MRHVSLNIGPSEVSEAVRRDLVEFATSDLLSESHRGPVAKGVLQDAVQNLRTAMGVPENYAVLFQPSATASMEVVCRNVAVAKSFHFVHGAFSGRMASTAAQVGLHAIAHETPWDEPTHPESADIDDDVELITLAHNETSTGLAWPWEEIRRVRERWADKLLAIDVTSSFGAMHMDWTLGDVWYFSVQKCMGLPAGLGVMLVGPRALARAQELGDKRNVVAWQELGMMVKRIATGETTETPNILDIALLSRQCDRWDLDAVHAATRAKAELVWGAMPDDAFHVRERAWRSLTAHTLTVDDPEALKARALDAGYVIGGGYGPLKATCIRLGTFPSVTIDHVREVMSILAG